MFYDENGRHIRTKKEILDSDGNIRKGCSIIKRVRSMSIIDFLKRKLCLKLDHF